MTTEICLCTFVQAMILFAILLPPKVLEHVL